MIYVFETVSKLQKLNNALDSGYIPFSVRCYRELKKTQKLSVRSYVELKNVKISSVRSYIEPRMQNLHGYTIDGVPMGAITSLFVGDK